MEWQQIVTLGVWAAAITAASNFLSTWWFARSQRELLAVYYATRICIELERYAYSCADLISEDSNYYSSSGHSGSQCCVLPSLVVDADTDWKTLDVHLVHRVLSFQNDIIRAQGVIAAEGYHLLPGDESEEPSAQAGLLGYRAYQIAADLRTKYRSLPPREVLHPWDYIELLKEKHDAKIAEYDQLLRNPY